LGSVSARYTEYHCEANHNPYPRPHIARIAPAKLGGREYLQSRRRQKSAPYIESSKE
jgi:hypothetical protein